jgi:DNA-binding NarL/FixJ family response regulator
MIETTRPNTPPVPTIVVSRPGIMQQSLRSWLASCRGIVVVASSGDGLTALRQVARHRPGMLVIDSNLLDEEVEALVAAAKAEHPALRCLVLLRANQHETQITAWGADAVARRDESAQQLQAALAKLGHVPCGPQA